MEEKAIHLQKSLPKLRETVYRYFLYKIQDPDVAEDLTQEVLVQACEKISSFTGKGSLSRWILAIAKHKFYDWLRRTKSLSEPLHDNLQDDCDVEGLFTQNYISQCLQEQIASLPRKESQLLKLRFFEGLSPQQIARQLQCTPSAAKVALSRAKKELKNVLAKECDFYFDQENKLCCTRKQDSPLRSSCPGKPLDSSFLSSKQLK